MAAVLASGPGAVVSHRDAAALLGLWDIRHARIDITTDRRSRKAQPGILLHRVRRLTEDERTEVQGIPVTSVARTAVDLTDLVGRPRLTRILREADYRGLLDLDALDKAIARAHGRRRVSLLVDALEEHRPGLVVRSELEHRFLELCREHGLAAPEMNVRKTISGRRYELDCLWRAERVVVELDGAAAHSSVQAFEADRARDAALSAAGFTPLRYTWRRLEHDERGVVAELAALLERPAAGRVSSGTWTPSSSSSEGRSSWPSSPPGSAPRTGRISSGPIASRSAG